MDTVMRPATVSEVTNVSPRSSTRKYIDEYNNDVMA